MTRRPSEAKIKEYEELKRFFVLWETKIAPNPYFDPEHPHHPINSLASIEQRFSFSQALDGLRQAVNDSLEDAQDWNSTRIKEADELLQEVGAPTLSLLLVSRPKVFRAILRRKRIKDDTEYYLVSAALADTDTVRSSEELELLGTMLASYEARA